MDKNKILKIKEGFLLRELAGKHIVVPTGNATLDFNGMITLNETGAYLWSKLENGASAAELIKAIASEYRISETEAESDVYEFIEQLEGEQLLERLHH